MAYYGVSYRGGARIGQGFQRPQPSPDQGGRAPPRRPGRQGAGAGGRRGGGKLADILKDAAEQAAKQWAKDRFARFMWNQFSPWRRAKFTARIAKYLLLDGPPPWDDLFPWQTAQPGRIEAGPGWHRCVGPTDKPQAYIMHYDWYGYNPGDWVPYCSYGGLSFQVPQGDISQLNEALGAIPPGMVPYVLMVGPYHLGDHRFVIEEVWWLEMPLGSPYRGDIWFVPETLPVYQPAPAPWFTPWPEDAPILQPTPLPRHVPYPKVPHLPDSPWPQGRKTAQPDNRTPPYLPPYADPQAGPALETDGGGLSPAPPHVFLPPGPGQKEKKGRLRGGPLAAKMIADALGGLMEGADWVDAAWRALPKDKRCKASTPQAKLECLWKNADHIDIGQFVANAIVMEASDRLQGYVGRALAKASRRAGFQPGRGLQTGGAATRYAQQAAADLLKGL